MNSQEIQERQNEEKYLKVQYAARVYFNSAEKYNYLAWVACLVSAFSIFLPGSWSPYIINGIPFIADIFAVILSLVASYKIKWASKLRKYFDSYVLNIDMNQRSETDIRKMRERTEKICCKNPNDTAIQIANTGKDSPPGVRNWYEFSSFYSGFEAQFECQRQNAWWNSKMFQKRLFVIIFASIIITTLFLFFMVNNHILTVILCSAGFIIKIIERLVENAKYIRLSILIDGAQQAIETHPTSEGVKKLQDLIDERRATNVLELNFLHKKSADTLSRLYENSIS